MPVVSPASPKASRRRLQTAALILGLVGSSLTVGTLPAEAHHDSSTDACPTVFSFKPSDFVLSTYQRMRGGTVRGDEQMAEKIRDLLFKI